MKNGDDTYLRSWLLWIATGLATQCSFSPGSSCIDKYKDQEANVAFHLLFTSLGTRVNESRLCRMNRSKQNKEQTNQLPINNYKCNQDSPKPQIKRHRALTPLTPRCPQKPRPSGGGACVLGGAFRLDHAPWAGRKRAG